MTHHSLHHLTGGADPLYFNKTFAPLEVFSHTISNESAYGVMSHYWSTGEVVNWDTIIDYYVDGEGTPSISLMEDMVSIISVRWCGSSELNLLT